MKKINLIEWLSRNSHEKQTPQRFARYAVMLIMLLTLGVGQMWAYDLTFRCVPKQIWGNNWTEGSSKVKINAQDENGTWRYIVMTGTSETWGGYKIYSGKLTDFSSDKAHNIQFQRLNSSSDWQEQLEWGDYKDGSFICSQIRTNTGWTDYKIDHSIAAGSTIVWDMAGNDKSWAAVYLYRDVNNGSDANDAFTRIGTTTQWHKTYASASNYIASFQFRSNNSNWNDYTHTTNIERNVSGVTLFTYDNTNNGGSPKKLNWQVTTSAKKATSGTKIYFDNTNASWGEVWLKYGTQWYNRSSAATATQVTGTDALYVITIPNDCYYAKWYLADHYGYTGYNNIETMTDINNRIAYQETNISSDITYIPSTGSGTPKVWTTTTMSGHTRTLTITAPSNGSISATYTDENGDEQTVTSGSFSVAQTCKVTITATPSSGYALSALTLGGEDITSGAEQIIRANGTIAATFVAETTHDVTVSYKIGTRMLHADRVVAVGETTPSNISSETVDGFSFSSWSNLTSGITNVTGNTTTDPIRIKTTADASMTCNYTQWPCSLDIVPSEGATTYTSRTPMSYDATTKAYYKNVSTASSTERYRFYIDSKEYSTSGNTELVIAGTKVDANTPVQGYGSNKPSVYFNDGPSGSNITIWFDYENKKAWVTEQKHTVTISAGANGSVSPTSVSVGNVVASSTITATASDHYHWSSWDVPSGVTIASGSGTRQITIKATADSKTVTASFAGDVYTITYRDQGDVEFSGTQSTPPTTHTYGASTTLKIPTKTGYDFGGWFTTPDCASGAVGNTSTASLGATAFTGNITLYAKWTAKNYTAENNLKDVDNVANGQYNVNYYSTSINHTVAPSKSGYELQGYYKEAACTNLIANPDLTLHASTSYTTSASEWNQTSAPVLYLKWTQTVTLNANTGNHGSGDNTSATIVYNATAKTSITHCTPATGYHLVGYYTAATDGTKVLNVDGSFAAATVTDYITDSKWTKAGATTLFAHYEPNTYDVILDVNGATTGSNQTVTATFDADMPTTQKGGSTPISAPSKTGYTFGGYYANSNGTGTQYYTSGLASNHVWDVATNNTTIYAKWTANPYTVTLNIDEDNHGTIAGKATSASVTFDAAPTAIAAGQLPTAAQGYAFMGFFTAAGGEGVQVINANGTWIASVTGYTDGDAKWVRDGDATLYAYYKKAEITALTITPSTAGLGATVTVTPTIDPMPTGTYQLCWKLLRNNDNEITGTDFDLTSDPDDDPNTVQFTAPSTSGTYKVKCILRTGSSCDGGEELDNMVQSFTVAGEHTITIRYQDASGRTLAASTEVTGRPLTWSEAIAAPPITGYAFTRWEAGDGIILSTDGTSELGSNTTTTNPVYVKATYAGNLTAVYNKKNVLYFNNTLGWEHVYVYFYSDGNYWDSNKNKSGTTEEYVFGSGAQTTKTINATTPFSEGHYGEMTRIAGTNIYYFDWQAEGWSHTNYVTFTKDDRYGYEYFDNTEVVRLADAAHYYDKAGTMMMYVPLTSVYEIRNRHDANLTKYYTEGYWMNYPENTGYTLKIFNKVSGDPAPVVVQDIPFEFTGDYAMPMSVTAELEAGRTYGYKIYRNDGSWFGNDGTMTNGASGDGGQTVWEFETGKNNCGLTTSAAGEYTFTLTYAPKSDTYYYLVGVHYPVAVGSYRLVYTDEATTLWSGHTKPANWYHPSRTIEKKDGAKDIISFYVSKETGANASIKVQYAREINASTGAITWADGTDAEHTSVTLDLSRITSSGVYNFHLTQADGSISVEKIEAYTGNYYIRTDCAGTTKWDNYRAADHQMTYSEFSKDRSTNTFGDLYTHYYMHWCPRETNIKFVIANDYSMCITDTLESDITDLNNIASGGYLNSQKNDGKSETDDIYSANIRFMYDERTNKISRAYMSSSTNTARKFLVLKSDTEFKNSDNTVLRGSGESATAGDYEAIFKDNEDWIYEREIRLAPGQKFKLYASYAQITAQEDGSQHFRGNYASNNWDNTENYVLLVGGSGDTCNARIVYDYKTNRLISAYLPDNNNAISGSPSINADIMIVRNHQEAGQQITFNTGASLNAVQTVYGVMRFNRWILNNRQNPEDMDRTHSEDNTKMNSHHPLITDPGSQRSSSERGLYWISFPFNVNLSEVFGFGTYGIHWIVMKYNGEERAKQGFWADSEGFWEYIWDRKDVVLEKGKGYVLALDLDRMKADDRTFWNNEIQQVELFFPSTATVGTIQQTDVNVDVPAWTCTIGPRFEGGDDRTKKDSHWNIIGVPSYANYNSELTDGSAIITWNANPETQDLPFLYEWNANDNTYTVQSGTSYPFKAMHAYYVQYHGTLHWSLASATPPSIVARRAYEKPQNEEFRLELQQNEKMEDQTFVKLSNDENASADFRFEEDLCKEFNSRKANIYTFIADVQAAGNTLPLSDHTTLVPVGVKTTAPGEYTFAMPEGTNGVGVVLVDNISGTRTNLALSDYTVALGKGDFSDRFMLEIAPIKQMPTDIENVQGDNVQGAKARKVMIDGILYIVKDGKVFDAQGKRLQ